MTMLADICMSSIGHSQQTAALKQSQHMLEELKIADPLRLPYWRAQLRQLSDSETYNFHAA